MATTDDTGVLRRGPECKVAIPRLLPRVSRMASYLGIALPGSKRALLAYRNLRRAGGRWWVSLFGIFFATFLMSIQGSLLYGFAAAASRTVDAVDADIWMVAKGTPAFEFVSQIPERYADLALGIDGVSATGRGVASWAPFQRSDGERTYVLAVGIEDAFRGRIPSLTMRAAAIGVADSAVEIDESDAHTLHYQKGVAHVQISNQRAFLIGTTTGFSTFLGPPLVMGRYTDVRRYVRYDRPDVGMVLVRVGAGADPAVVRNRLRQRFEDVDVWTAAEFSSRSRIYWLVQTGAGAALSLAAVLGFAIGLVIVAQTMYALTAENIEEFATLRTFGASDADIRSIVMTQSLICGTIGGSAGLVLVKPFTDLARSSITWMFVPSWMYALIPVLVLLLCIGAALIAVRPALTIDPGRVFRA
jgi:putative ABC transport system permease protein